MLRLRRCLGAALVGEYAAELEGAKRVGTIRGAELVGRRYEPLFPYFADQANAFRVLAGDFVDTEEGTGIVHLAPGFGEDELRNPIGQIRPFYGAEADHQAAQVIVA